MADAYFALTPEDKRDALTVAAEKTGRPPHLLEKDVWVVWTLKQLFSSPYGEHLVFKGGTSLSKAYDAIDRFSEDIDITYNIEVIAEDLVSQTEDGYPANNSQQSKWTKKIRERLADWAETQILPLLRDALASVDRDATVNAAGETVTISYPPATSTSDYVAPTIKIDFGARSTGEPSETKHVGTYAAPHLTEIAFPECEVRVMRAERTFWEKATAIHVFCLQGKLNGERYSRHWYDIVQLDKKKIVEAALKDRDLAKQVAKHKSVFFVEKDKGGTVIDYNAAVSGHLQLVPEGESRKLLAADYKRMLDDGLLPKGAESFDQILERCAEIQTRANDA